MRRAVCGRASSGAEQPCPRALSSWRLRPAAALLAAAGIAVLSALLPAAAQGATLVSNVGQARVSALGFSSFYMVQEFTTGANGSAGFTLSSVELRLSTISSSTEAVPPVVKIYSGSARGTLVATLLGPSNDLPAGTTDNYTYAVPSGTTVTLEDSKSYWVVADKAVASQHISWEATTADEEDATGLSDWAINNFGGWTASDTGTFSSYGTGAFQIRVNGEIITTNSAPTAADSEVSTLEDTDYVFGAGDFAFSDTDSGDALASVKVTTLPARGFGALEFDGTALASGDLPKTVTKAELDGGKLVFSPVSVQFGDDYASFMFKVSDGDADSAEYAMTVDVDADPAWSELVGNVGEAISTSSYLVGGASGKIATQGFRTGGGTQEFKLRSVGIDLSLNDFSGSETLTLSIYSSSADGTANATVHTLTTPWPSGSDIPSVGVVYFTAPADATLAANTDDHVVVHGSGDRGDDAVLELTEANGQTGESGWSIEDAYRRNGSTAGVIDSFKISVRGADPAPGTTRHYRVSAERTPVSQSARSMPRVQVATTRGQGSPKPTSSSCGRCSRRCSTTTALRHEERWRRDGSSCSGTRARSAMRPRTGLFERVRVRRVVDGEAVPLRSPGARELPAARAFDDDEVHVDTGDLPGGVDVVDRI